MRTGGMKAGDMYCYLSVLKFTVLWIWSGKIGK